MSISVTRTLGVAPHAISSGAVLIVLSLLAAFATFSAGLTALVDAWAVPEYSHGPLIPLISLFLFLREMRAAPARLAAPPDRWPGVAVVALGLAIGLVGDLANIDDITMYGFIVWCGGMVLACFGLRRGVLFWPAVLHLVFMLPLPQFVYWQVSTQLQLVSSEIGVGLIKLMGVPVFLDGNIIDLGVYKLQVAEACSGLRYLFPMLSFSYVFAVLYQGPKWHKVLLLLSAAPITVLMNSFRIGMIGVLVDSYGIEHAEGFLHTFEGWIIFVACVMILFGQAMVMQQFTARPRPLSECLDIEFTGMREQFARINDVVPTPSLIVAALLTATPAIVWQIAPEREVVRVAREPLALFPMTLDGREGITQILDPVIEQVLGADDYYGAAFIADDGRPAVDVFAAYYLSQSEGGGIHSPEVCIPAGGWEVSDWRAHGVSDADGRPFEVNRAIIQKGLNRQVVYYWFEQRGRRMTSDYAVKLQTVLDALERGRSDGGLVRLITPIANGETEQVADARLARFIRTMTPALERHFPQ